MLQTNLIILGTGTASLLGLSIIKKKGFLRIQKQNDVDLYTKIKKIKNGSDALNCLYEVQESLGPGTSSDELLTYIVDDLSGKIISEEVYARLERLVSASDFLGPESFSLVVFYSACQKAILETLDCGDRRRDL